MTNIHVYEGRRTSPLSSLEIGDGEELIEVLLDKDDLRFFVITVSGEGDPVLVGEDEYDRLMQVDQLLEEAWELISTAWTKTTDEEKWKQQAIVWRDKWQGELG
jgi:hypothetical protein